MNVDQTMLTTNANHLKRSAPERQGMDSSAILQFIEELERQIQEVHSVIVLRHGRVVAEGWWSPYRPEYSHALFSVSKSLTSTAVGLAATEGRFSIDDLVLSFFPDDSPAGVSDSLAAMSVRHLLTMSTGHTADTLPYLIDQLDGNWIKGFFEAPILHVPGTYFAYNTGATYMLSAIVQNTTGMKLIDYLQPRLFEPLGIRNVTWQESPQGIAVGGYGLSMKTEDLVRFGLLYLQKGKWGHRQIVPEAWVEASTSLQISNGDSSLQHDSTQGYGYQFWRCRHNAYRASGVFGQYCIVMPEQDVVLAVTGGIDVFDDQKLLDLVWEFLLPAMQIESIPENAPAQEALTRKLPNLNLPPVQGQVTSPISSQVSGQTYMVDDNELNIETIILNFAEPVCTVTVKTARGEETISCGYGAWHKGHIMLLNNMSRLPDESAPVVASGAWTAEDSFMMVVRLYETPFFYTFLFYFLNAEMLIEIHVNETLDSTKPILLTARR